MIYIKEKKEDNSELTWKTEKEDIEDVEMKRDGRNSECLKEIRVN